MEVSGLVTLFPKMRGTHKYFEGSISKKTEDVESDKEYENYTLEFKFGNKDLFTDEFFNTLEIGKHYRFNIKRGFLSVDGWEDKITKQWKKKLVIIICDATYDNVGDIENFEENNK